MTFTALPQTLKCLSWNVKHFSGRRRSRLSSIVKYLVSLELDVIALYEVKGSEIFGLMAKYLPEFNWFTTSGPQSQEILVGVRSTVGITGVEQRDEFRADNTYLRPGLVVTVQRRDQGPQTSFLFLHLKAKNDLMDHGIRENQYDALIKLFDFFKDRNMRICAAGDLNSLGSYYPYGGGVKPETEMLRLSKRLARQSAKVLSKDSDHTWTPSENSRYKAADLDHVMVNENIKVLPMGSDGEDVYVAWPPGYDARNKTAISWRDDYSDHAPLIWEIEG